MSKPREIEEPPAGGEPSQRPKTPMRLVRRLVVSPEQVVPGDPALVVRQLEAQEARKEALRKARAGRARLAFQGGVLRYVLLSAAAVVVVLILLLAGWALLGG